MVLSRIYRLGEKSQVAEGPEVPRGVQGHAPRKFFEMTEYALWCNLVQFETVLRNITVCALTLSRVDDFPIQLLVYCNFNNNELFWGEAGPFGGEPFTPQIP